jgi:parallel beta-helix repeat protein
MTLQSSRLNRFTQGPAAIAAITLLLGSMGATTLPSFASSPSPSQQVRTVYVDPTTGSDRPNAGSPTVPFRTITYALDQSNANTLIQLAAGNYSTQTGESFPLVIKPSVTLRGDEVNQGRAVRIIGGANFISPSFARQNVTIRAENGSKVSGITVTNPNPRGTGLWIESGSPIVINSTFFNNQREGVFITGNSSPKISNNIFNQNNGNGISAVRTSQGEIRGNLFQNTGFGIAINDSAAPLVADNKIIENKDGIIISQSAKPILRSNLIEKNVRDGIVAIAKAQPDLGTATSFGQNIIRSNGRYDLYNATRTNTIFAIGNQLSKTRTVGPINLTANR